MADNKICPENIDKLYKQLTAKLGGHEPLPGNSLECSAGLHRPTLYPVLNVPAGPDGDWGEVARAIAHHLSILDGVPELVVAGNDADAAIAADLNSELQIIAAAKEDLQPKPQWRDPDALGNFLETILHPEQNALDAQKHFCLIKLHRFVLDNHPSAQAALDIARKELPDETNAATMTFNAILEEDLRTPSGKAAATTKLLGFLGFDAGQFYLRRTQHIPGVNEDRSIGYYPALETIKCEFMEMGTPSGMWLKFQLPFALPVLEGIYRTDDAITFVRHVRVMNTRAGWQSSSGARIDSMSTSGLYAQSVVELLLPKQFEIDPSQPPGDLQYKNINCYPEAVRVVTLRLNKLIVGLRAETGHSDIPEVLPSDLNHIEYGHFDPAGRITDTGSVNFEHLRASFGAPPRLQDEIRLEAHTVDCVAFSRELLESAKFYVSAYNIRRAVLDFAGAFEAFLSESVTPRLGEVRENTKDQFLRRYGSKLSEEVRSEIENINLAPENDPLRIPTIRRLLDLYGKRDLQPILDKNHVSNVMGITSHRNDAAHGRPVPSKVLDDLIVAIESLDILINDHHKAKTSD